MYYKKATPKFVGDWTIYITGKMQRLFRCVLLPIFIDIFVKTPSVDNSGNR